jgi:16S rRNA (guanine527-N7)-methyltransferase
MSEAEEFAGALAEVFGPFGRLSGDQVAELSRHYGLLVRWNKTVNLTSVSGLEETVVRHYCESLFLGLQLPAASVSVLDVGSGAGFPGIPMAILRPDCRFTLAESHQRKAVFLREATRHLARVRVAAGRAEELGETFDWVVSRAVKWSGVVGLSATRRAGALGLLLGRDDAEEVLNKDEFAWLPAIPLPWGKRRVVMIGHRRST